jgi:hypothetical protein
MTSVVIFTTNNVKKIVNAAVRASESTPAV